MNINTEKDLTLIEMKCCHLSQGLYVIMPLQQWRDEFWTQPHTDHCHDCPAIKNGRKITESAPLWIEASFEEEE